MWDLKLVLNNKTAIFVLQYIDLKFGENRIDRFQLFGQLYVQTLKVGEDTVRVNHVGWIPCIMVDGYNLGIKVQLLLELLEVLYLTEY